MKMLRLLPLAMLALLFSCTEDKAPKVETPITQVKSPEEELVATYCGNCHLAPTPDMLDKKTWRDHVLVRMAAYNGVFYDNVQFYDSLPAKWLEPGEGGERVLAAGVYPAKPVFTRDEFMKIRQYFLDRAPTVLPAPQHALPVAEGLPLFKVRPLLADPSYVALVTAVAIDPASHKVYTAFLKQGVVEQDLQGKVLRVWPEPKAVVHIRPTDGQFCAADIGNIRGADAPIGQYWMGKDFAALAGGRSTVRMDKLMRPVYSEWADLDSDGDEDLLLCEYGNLVGKLAWHRNDGGKFVEQLLHNDDGTLTARVADFNGDGIQDILSLCANSDEGVDVYVGKGKGQFERRRVLRFPPVNGTAALELVDWDKNGKMDLLISAGDNGDYPAIPKPYHGLYLYLNKGDFQFELETFLPIHGAYGTRSHDYDQDGDIDIAAVSFYPDFAGNPRQSFVFFDNRGSKQFVAATFAGYGDGRWMVMDAGDVDGDGDQDVVLGAFNALSSEVPQATLSHWDEKNISVMFLENIRK
jgi:hypothetical protein